VISCDVRDSRFDRRVQGFRLDRAQREQPYPDDLALFNRQRLRPRRQLRRERRALPLREDGSATSGA
jgi:hypothetical protein